jgi:hypothetical protein
MKPAPTAATATKGKPKVGARKAFNKGESWLHLRALQADR